MMLVSYSRCTGLTGKYLTKKNNKVMRKYGQRTVNQVKEIKSDHTTAVLVSNDSYRVPVPLPNEGTQLFSLPKDKSGLRSFLSDIKMEDHGVKNVELLTVDGMRISRNTYTDELLINDFFIKINETLIHVKSPLISHVGQRVVELDQSIKKDPNFVVLTSFIKKQLQDVDEISVDTFFEVCKNANIPEDKIEYYLKTLTTLGYILRVDSPGSSGTINIKPRALAESIEEKLNLADLFMSQKERVILLETLKAQLAPLEEKYHDLELAAERRSIFLAWSGFFFLTCQFIFFARLTWWDYSWDVIEPITYFTTMVETCLAGYVYFVMVKKDYSFVEAKDAYVQRRINRLSKRRGFNLKSFVSLKQRIADLESTIN